MKSKKYIIDNLNLMKEWDWVKNNEQGFHPSKISTGSNKKVWWKCVQQHSYQSTVKHRTNGGGCPVCLNQIIVSGINDLAAVDPMLLQEWDYEKNEMQPTEIGAGSKKKAFWKCEHGHSWSAVIYDRYTKKTKCPYCSGKLVITGTNDLKTLYPKLINEWDFQKNKDISPDKISVKSGRKVWWKCEKGHSWNAIVSSRTAGIGCPQCASEKQTSFPEQAIYFFIKKIFPDAVNRYIIDKKEIDIFIPSYSVGIEYDGYFWHKNKIKFENKKDDILQKYGIFLIRVREKGLFPTKVAYNIILHDESLEELERAIRSIITKLSPNTDKKEINISKYYNEILQFSTSIEKENSIAKNRSLMKEWNYDKNGLLKPEFFSLGSRKKVWWKCSKCGYEYRMAVISRVNGQGCSVCAGNKNLVVSGFNDLLTKNPSLAKEWNLLKNNISTDSIPYNTSKKYWWIGKCGHEWQASVKDRMNGTDCPYCAGKKVLQGFNDVATTNPEILDFWDDNIYSPFDLTRGSSRVVNFKCKKGHKFSLSIKRFVQGERCAICSGRRIVSGINSLAVINPELASQWHPYKNENLSADDIAPNSMKKVWWLGECGHEWEATVANRNSKKSGCPICANKKK